MSGGMVLSTTASMSPGGGPNGGGFFARLLDTSGFPPRWRCGTSWSPELGWLHIVSDVLIAGAYLAIPAMLVVLLRRRRDVPFPLVMWLFVAFILSCGITHLIEATLFYQPWYRLSGLMKAVTAGVSIATVVVLARVLPSAVGIPGVLREHRALVANSADQARVLERVEQERATLERRAAELTTRERRLRDAVGAARACALSWEADSGRILWEMGFGVTMRAAGLEWAREFDGWSTLIGPQAERRLLEASRDAVRTQTLLHRRFPLLGHEGVWDVRLTATPEPPVAGQPGVVSGLFGLVPTADSIVREE